MDHPCVYLHLNLNRLFTLFRARGKNELKPYKGESRWPTDEELANPNIWRRT